MGQAFMAFSVSESSPDVINCQSEGCYGCRGGDQCDSELDYEVWLENDKILAVKLASGTYDLASTPEGYIVIEE